MNEMTPVFVKIDEYKEVLDILEVIKGKIDVAQKTLDEIRKLKDEEDRELSSWSSNLDSITEKIGDIDKTIFSKG
jgi:hypothetical protein